MTTVNHPRFGKGQITEVTGDSKLDKVTIAFESGETHSFIIKQSNLTVNGKPFMGIKINTATKGSVLANMTDAERAEFEADFAAKYGENTYTMQSANRNDIMGK